ncbi:MAG: hypothetical protein DWH80_16510 [Planctomycetota bacterium]|nr:MAG: hypothetical protein DWH80_16510 [Planctomycetota bacterium]
MELTIGRFPVQKSDPSSIQTLYFELFGVKRSRKKRKTTGRTTPTTDKTDQQCISSDDCILELKKGSLSRSIEDFWEGGYFPQSRFAGAVN